MCVCVCGGGGGGGVGRVGPMLATVNDVLVISGVGAKYNVMCYVMRNRCA